MRNKINIVSTKKLLPNQKQLLVEANFVVIEEDFIQTKSIDFELEKVNQNLIFTSQNAVQSILQHPKCTDLKSKNVFSVGMKTKELLTENGFNVIAYTGYASDLAEIISLIYNKESFTFFSGNLRRDILPNTLKENQIEFNEIQVYETDLTSKKITDKLDGILFFSPSAVESYLKSNTIKNEICFCIGETTAEVLVPRLRDKKIENIVIADKPSVENVIAEVIEYYKN
jgi:uroporphyrinogen-III synthase